MNSRKIANTIKSRLKRAYHWFWQALVPWVSHTLEKPWLTKYDDTVPNKKEELQRRDPVVYAKTALYRPKAPSITSLALGKGWDMFQNRRLPDGTGCHEYLLSSYGETDNLKEELYARRTKEAYKDDQDINQLTDYDMPAAHIAGNGGSWVIALFYFSMMLTLNAFYGLLVFVPAVTFIFVLPLMIYLEGIVNVALNFHLFFLTLTPLILISLVLYCIQKVIWESRVLHRIFWNPKVDVALRRDKGILVLYKKNKVHQEIPFDELEATLSTVPPPTSHSTIYTALSLRHTKTNKVVWHSLTGQPVGPGQEVTHAIWWEIWQQFMDASRPLPDIPMFEPYRHLDPTTIEWDKKHGRPPNYWENLDKETFDKLVKESTEAAINYPFTDEGKVKEVGWKPAGDGKHWYQLG